MDRPLLMLIVEKMVPRFPTIFCGLSLDAKLRFALEILNSENCSIRSDEILIFLTRSKASRQVSLHKKSSGTSLKLKSSKDYVYFCGNRKFNNSSSVLAKSALLFGLNPFFQFSRWKSHSDPVRHLESTVLRDLYAASGPNVRSFSYRIDFSWNFCMIRFPLLSQRIPLQQHL